MKPAPDDRDTLARDYRDLPMFAPPPPTGPQTDTPAREANRYAAYQVWKRSEEGGKAFGWMLMESRRLLEIGEKRISTKALFEEYRATHHVTLNNSYTGWVSDALVAADSRLLDVIERRKRRKAAA